MVIHYVFLFLNDFFMRIEYAKTLHAIIVATEGHH